MATFEPRANTRNKSKVRDIIDVYNKTLIQNPETLGGGNLAKRIAEHNIASLQPKPRKSRRTAFLRDPEQLGGGTLANVISNYQRNLNKPSEIAVTPRSTRNVFSGLASFLSSFGSKLNSLVSSSNKRLSRLDPIEAVTLSDRTIEALTAKTQEAIKQAFDKYSQGRIDRKAFRTEMEMQIRRLALGAAIIGVQGAGNLTSNVLNAVQNRVAQQLAYLDGFLKDIEGRTLTNRDRSRALQYANAAFSIAQTAQRQFNLDTAKDANKVKEMRQLGEAEHCDDCVELADDCQPMGTLPVPGTGTKCGNNCKCRIVICTNEDEEPNRTQESSASDL